MVYFVENHMNKWDDLGGKKTTTYFWKYPSGQFMRYTPQNKHGSPENGGPLEKEIPIGFTIISRCFCR